DVYSVGSNNGDGASVITGIGGTQAVAFQNIEPTFDNVPAPLIVNATSAANAIDYTEGGAVTTGLVTIDNFESIEFIHKHTLTINSLEGSDEISIHNDNVPTDLTDITVNGDDPTASDRLVITGTAGADAFTFAGVSPSAGDVTGLAVDVHFTSIEHAVLD